MDMGNLGFEEHQEAGPTLAPVVPNGVTPILPEWRRLSAAIKGFLADNWGITSIEEYNSLLNSPDEVTEVEEQLKCRELNLES
jgi:hypothetical protein